MESSVRNVKKIVRKEGFGKDVRVLAGENENTLLNKAKFPRSLSSLHYLMAAVLTSKEL